MTNDLDSFETQLLAELRTTVTARSASQQLSQLADVTRRRLGIGAAASAVAAAIVGMIVVPGLFNDPAYAVQDGPSGTVEVEVNRLEDAAGLEQALSKHGVKADVQYLGEGLKCAPGRYRSADSVPDSSTRFTVGTDGISVTLDRRDVDDNKTVVIAASRISDGIYAEVGIADGPVQDCQPDRLSQSDVNP